MTFLFWALVVILGLALLNGIACWFGLDVAQEAEDVPHGAHAEQPHGKTEGFPPHSHPEVPHGVSPRTV